MPRVTELDLETPDGRTIHTYDTGPRAGDELVVFWHHGTPNTGGPPEPLLDLSERLGIRWLGYDRPGYGGSTPNPGRSVASVAKDVLAVTEAFGIDRFSTMGHSGGGPHALATAARLPDRVLAVVSIAGLAPSDADRLEWYSGMCASGTAALQAAAQGREAKERHERDYGNEYDPEFNDSDLAALAGEWSWLNRVVEGGSMGGPGPLIDDDLAYVSRWGFDVGQITTPVLLVHGDQDRIVPSSHSEWLAERIPGAQFRVIPGAGHISVLAGAGDALRWITETAG